MAIRARCLVCGKFRDVPGADMDPIARFKMCPYDQHDCLPMYDVAEYELILETRARLGV